MCVEGKNKGKTEITFFVLMQNFGRFPSKNLENVFETLRRIWFFFNIIMHTVICEFWYLIK
jgi:hypothetical protein